MTAARSLAISLPGSGSPGSLRPGAGGLGGGAVIPVFPQAPLDVRVELGLAGTWTPVTPYALQREGTSPPISITRGRQNETSQATPSSVAFQWNNRDGRFTPRNPTGVYYGLLNRNSPLRVSVPYGSTYLRFADDRTSYAWCPDSSALQITGSIDVRIDMDLDDWQESSLVSKWGTTASTRAWNLSLATDGSPVFRWQDSGGTEHAYQPVIPLPLGRIAIRAVLNATAGTLTFYTAPTMSGSWTQFGGAFSVGATSIKAASGQPVQIGYAIGMDEEYPASAGFGFPGLAGRVYEVQVYNSGGTLVADPQFMNAATGLGWWDFETGTQNWAPTNATIATTDSWSFSDQNSLQITATGAGGTYWQAYGPFLPCVPGQVVTAQAVVRAGSASTLNDALIELHFAGTADTYDQSAPVTLYSGQQATLTVSGTAPSTATMVQAAVVDNEAGTSGQVMLADLVIMQGFTAVSDAQGNPWALSGTAGLSDRSYRGHFETSAFPRQWDTSGTDVWVPAQGGGVLRRLQQGSSPVMSAMKRAITSLIGTGTFAPAAYWMCEDPAGSTSIASGLPNGAPMAFNTAPTFQGTAGSPQADSNFPCSASLPQIGSSIWTGSVSAPAGTTWTANVTRCLLYETAGSIPDSTVLMRVHTTGTVRRMDLLYGVLDGGSLKLIGYNSAGAQVFVSTWITFVLDGLAWRVSMDLLNAGGGNITWQLQAMRPGENPGTPSGSFSGTVGAVTEIIMNPAGVALGSTEIGHISVQSAWESLFTQSQPLNAWNGEAAAARFARLCGENSISSRVYGAPAASVPMGYQPIDTLPNLMQYIENTDRGQLYDPAECLGLGYRTSASLCNQTPAVTLNYAATDLGGDGSSGLQPTYDDLELLNDVTLSRANGSSYEAQITSGPSSILPPAQGGVGAYDTSQTVYCAWDGQLPSIASWWAWIGSIDTDRYPVIPLNLARSQLTAFMQAILDTRIGDYTQVTSPPPWEPPGPISQLAWGQAEGLGGFFYLLAWNAVPESPYQVGVYGASAGAAGAMHYDTAGSQLNASCAAAATSLSVAVTAGSLWTTSAGDFPFSVMVGGELMTVTGISGASSPQTFTVTRSVNGVSKPQAAGAAVNIWAPPVYALTGAV